MIVLFANFIDLICGNFVNFFNFVIQRIWKSIIFCDYDSNRIAFIHTEFQRMSAQLLVLFRLERDCEYVLQMCKPRNFYKLAIWIFYNL